MRLIITSDPTTAMRRIRDSSRRHFGYEPACTGPTLTDLLSSLPILTKPDLVQFGTDHVDEILSQGLLFSETSGTTSAPLQTPRSAIDLEWNAINQMNAYKACVQPGVDRVAILHPGVLSPFVEASALALRYLNVGHVRVFPVPGVCDYRRIHEVFDRYRITTVMSTPTLVYKLIYELKRIGQGRLPKFLKSVLATGERFCPANARNIERILGPGSRARPFVYGSSETATLMTGNPDCTYQPIMEDFVFELPLSADHEVPASGNLIVTWLRDGMLPILRYDTGDFFTATEREGGGYVFEFEGRHGNNVLGMKKQQAIEAALYRLSVPIYHFELGIDGLRRQLRLVLVTEPGTKIPAGEVGSVFRSALDAEWKWAIADPGLHSFHHFSPGCKARRFQHA